MEVKIDLSNYKSILSTNTHKYYIAKEVSDDE